MLTGTSRSRSVQIASTQREKDEIYELRREVYIDEMKDWSRHADSDVSGKLVQDDCDETAYHFYIRQGGRIAAAARLNLRRDGPFECEEHFDLERFSPAFPAQISSTSRLVVHPSLQGSVLLKDLCCAIYEFGRDRGLHFDFIDCHPRLLSMYTRLGYRIYKPGFRHPKYIFVIPMVLVGDDVDHLKAVRSPFLSVAERFHATVEGRELLLSRFPDARMTFAPTDLDQSSYWDLMRTRLLDANATVKNCEMFNGFTEEQVKMVASHGHMIACEAGEQVLLTRDPGREVFVVLEGTLRVVIPTVRSDQPTVVRLLTPGDVIGEVAFFTDGLRCASVQTVEKSKLLVLDTRALQRLRKSEPELAAMFFYNMSQILAYRLRDTARF